MYMMHYLMAAWESEANERWLGGQHYYSQDTQPKCENSEHAPQ